MKKYTKGKKIKKLKRFMAIYRDQKPVWWRNRYTTMGFIQNWQFRVIIKEFEAGRFYEVKKLKEEDIKT
jgi:hypothetical protein